MKIQTLIMLVVLMIPQFVLGADEGVISLPTYKQMIAVWGKDRARSKLDYVEKSERLEAYAIFAERFPSNVKASIPASPPEDRGRALHVTEQCGSQEGTRCSRFWTYVFSSCKKKRN